MSGGLKMVNYLKNKFALTDQGAKDLTKSSMVSFFVYVVNMFPAILLIFFVEDLLKGTEQNKALYLIASVIIISLMYFSLNMEYEKLYNATYKESKNLRINIVEMINRLPMSYFSKHDLSNLSQTIMNDVDSLEHAISHAIPKNIGFYIFLPIVSIALIVGNYKLGLAVILPNLLSFLLMHISKKMQVRGVFEHHHQLKENAEKFQEAIEMQKEIKSLGLSETIKKSLYAGMEEAEKLRLRANNLQVLPLGIAELIGYSSIAIVVLVATKLYAIGEVDIVYVLGYLLATMKIKEGVSAITQNIAEIYALESKTMQIKEMQSTSIRKGEEVRLDKFDIEFRNVAFAYDQSSRVLKDINFRVEEGHVGALVGVSGCGKTSILRLVAGLYDYDDGSIKIGGKEIRDISVNALFENLSVVFQEVILFNTTIMENIRMGNMQATDEEVKKAASMANCEEFICKLPEGYDTLIGENGVKLSGGERQRLSIARAMLKNAPILLLDEISASLDVDNEQKIQESLNRLTQNKTVLIISHRIKSIQNVDEIIVVDQGVVEQSGRHEDLIRNSSVYQKLVEKSQLASEFRY